MLIRQRYDPTWTGDVRSAQPSANFPAGFRSWELQLRGITGHEGTSYIATPSGFARKLLTGFVLFGHAEIPAMTFISGRRSALSRSGGAIDHQDGVRIST
jgi:hypothetical protein